MIWKNKSSSNTLFRTERLFVRTLLKNDWSTIYSYRNDFEVKFFQNYEKTTADEIKELVLQNTKLDLSKTISLFAICLLKTNEMIGEIYLYNASYSMDKSKKFYLGFSLIKSFWKQNYAYEAVYAMINYLKTKLHSVAFVCDVYEKNLSSIKLIRRLGFSYLSTIESKLLNNEEKEAKGDILRFGLNLL